MATRNINSHDLTPSRTIAQKVCIGLGIVFVMAGLLGMIVPGLMGLHLSMAHNVIHLLSGALAIWAGYSDDPKKAYNFALGFGVVYGLLGLAGFMFGEAAIPRIPDIEPDQNVLRIIPGALVLATADHILHLVLSSVFLLTAMVSRKHHYVNTADRRRSESYFSTNDSVPNSESDLSDASLGHSDINRTIDKNRRSDFERRV